MVHGSIFNMASTKFPIRLEKKVIFYRGAGLVHVVWSLYTFGESPSYQDISKVYGGFGTVFTFQFSIV